MTAENRSGGIGNDESGARSASMLKRLMCWLLGHRWERLRYTEYGPSIEGWVTTVTLERCKRCYKKQQIDRAYKV